MATKRKNGNDGAGDLGGWLTTRDAVDLVPGGATYNTVWRWMASGVRMPGGKGMRRLRTSRIGGRCYTRAEWVREFLGDVGLAPASKKTMRK